MAKNVSDALGLLIHGRTVEEGSAVRIGEEAGMHAEGLAGGKRCGTLIYGTDGEDEGLGG